MTQQSLATSDKLDGAVLKVAGVVVIGAIMSILDVTVVSVALPKFQSEFDASYARVAWTMTAYTLALATVIPLSGWAADRFGTKRLYMVALALFTIGSGLCAMADTIGELIGFRVLQGLGGGMLMPLGMTIMTRAAGPHRIGRLMAVLGIPMLLGPIGGPILGGWLIDTASWHWIFLINLPIGVIALIYAQVALPKDAPEPSESFDFVGMLMLSPGLALFLYGVSSLPEAGTFAEAKVWAPMLVGGALVVAFVLYSFKPRHPLLDLRLFRNRSLTIASVTMFVFIIAFMGAGLLFPSYFLQVRGESTLAAGLLMAPQGIGAMITMPIAGTLADRVPIGRTVPFALGLIVVGFFGFTQVDPQTSYWLLGGSLFVMGLGMGGTMMPIMTSALRTLSANDVARGSTLVNILQQIGGSVGAAVMSVILTNELNGSRPIPGLVDESGKPVTEAGLAIAAQQRPELLQQMPVDPSIIERGLDFAAKSFASTFWVAFALVVLTIIPAAFLPRRRQPAQLDDPQGEQVRTPVVIH
ncbi:MULTISPECIES: DHA2 family efflux MFS transporter permease subunit [Micromonospora]|uniref:DHA2 family efflux MFS transporter permease subunit n=1 Tax=Micromonospora TaxID=1873 RepID=UPI001EE805B8|nr:MULTISPECIES: DHA2 family efflux MFS transporter permease subunit [Micromonospora]MCG5447696.1 DHA2 family efflux MFS transporter permease subunit [Micromonospora hortensis]MCX5116107.1 DHA2 family efflux MFS transporter permease subunit [Micromonospora sp. NBC_00362]WTI05611.1 DHA2 family efflux MFS transporter permease subunit [Micromonospora sp. NBC_00821]